MIRTILPGLAVAAVLSASEVPPAAAQLLADDMLISSFQTGGTASRATRKAGKSQKAGRRAQPKASVPGAASPFMGMKGSAITGAALSGRQRRQRLYYEKIPFQYAPTKDAKR